MKKNKLILFFGSVFLITVNIYSSRIFSSQNRDLNYFKTVLAQSENPDDERNVQVNCHIHCISGETVYGKMIICREGNIDCTPRNAMLIVQNTLNNYN